MSLTSSSLNSVSNMQKYVIMSFDDSPTTDEKLIKMLKKYGFKAVFALNTNVEVGSPAHTTLFDRYEVRDFKNIYSDQYVCSHGSHHMDMKYMDENNKFDEEIVQSKKVIEDTFGIKTNTFIYPGGNYTNESIKNSLKNIGVVAARSVISKPTFDAPKDPLFWETSSHIQLEPQWEHAKHIPTLINEFVNISDESQNLIHIWGHSWEWKTQKEWDYLEEILALLKQKNIKSISYEEYLEIN